MNRITYWLDLLVKWLVRPRNLMLVVGCTLLTSGVGLLGFWSADWTFWYRDASISVAASDSKFDWLAIILIVFGAIMLLVAVLHEFRLAKRQRTVFVDIRGFAPCVENPLLPVIEKRYKNVSHNSINLLAYLDHNTVANPEKVLGKIDRKVGDVFESLQTESAPEDVRLVLGGLAPVPFLFALGYLLSKGDTQQFDLFDYDRHQSGVKAWHSLESAPRQNNALVIDPTKRLTSINSSEVVVVLSITYPVDIEPVKETFSNIPVIQITLERPMQNAMNAASDLAELQNEFLSLLSRLMATGVSKVHLIASVQASTAIALGKKLNRNHPLCLVYQYEPKASQTYPWAIELGTKVSLYYSTQCCTH